MQKRFLTYLKREIGLQSDHSVLLAVSGGIDSMTLMHLFEQTDFTFAVAHCNFQLRQKDSDGDEKMIYDYCKSKNIPFYSKRFRTKEIARERNISTQMAARELRYTWFDTLLNEYAFDFLATAHHAEDNLETVLLNLVRGTGVRGLKGILPKKGSLIRPLLFAERSDIEACAKANGIVWREDSSNSKTDYKRNFIRHKITPLLLELNPSLHKTFQDTAGRMSMVHDFYESSFASFKEQRITVTNDGYSLNKVDFFNHSNRVFVNQWLEDIGFDYQLIKSALLDPEIISGSVFNGKDYSLLIDREKVFVCRTESQRLIETFIDENEEYIDLEGYRFRIEIISEFPEKRDLQNQKQAFLDKAKLTFPLLIRNWKEGDRFKPFGMSGKKLVSDYLIDHKIPLHEKKKQLVLLSGDEIVWLVNQRISNDFGINKTTESILKIELIV